MVNDSNRYVLISVAMAAFLTPFMGSSINLAIPSIGANFHTDAVMLSWVVTSYLLASAAFLVPMGKLADMVGRKRVFVTGVALFAAFSYLCGMANSISNLIFFRVLQGVGSSMIFGTGTAILTSAFPPQERGKVLGVNVAAVYIGLSLGPVLGGFLNHNFGWQAIFHFSGSIAIIAFIITLWKLKCDWVGFTGGKYDLLGAVLYSLGLVGFMYGLSSYSSNDYAILYFLAGIIMLVIFGIYETKIKYPVLDLKLFTSNITFSFSNVAAFINYAATFAVTFLLSLYLQSVRGYDSQAAGFILLVQPVVMALLSPLAGSLSDRMEPRLVASMGMAISTVALFFFWFMGANTPIILVMANLIIIGIGFALFSSPNTNAVMGSVNKEIYGLASSTLGTSRLVGQAISMAVVTLLISLYIGNIELSQAPIESIVKLSRIAFVIFTFLCGFGVFASLARGNNRVAQEEI